MNVTRFVYTLNYVNGTTKEVVHFSEELLTLADVSTITGKDRCTTQKWVHTGALAGAQDTTGKWVINYEDLRKFLQEYKFRRSGLELKSTEEAPKPKVPSHSPLYQMWAEYRYNKQVLEKGE